MTFVNNAEENSFHTSKSFGKRCWGGRGGDDQWWKLKIFHVDFFKNPRQSPNLLRVLLHCLVATSFQSVHRRGTGLTEVDYSRAFGWLGQTARQLPERGFSRDWEIWSVDLRDLVLEGRQTSLRVSPKPRGHVLNSQPVDKLKKVKGNVRVSLFWDWLVTEPQARKEKSGFHLESHCSDTPKKKKKKRVEHL